MLKKKDKPLDNKEIIGFLGEGTELKGELRFAQTFRIDGTFAGKILSDSTLVVGETGKVEAEIIDVRSMLVSGEVRGSVKVRERLELMASARFVGDLTMGSHQLVIEEGALFEGSVEMSPEGEGSGRGKVAQLAPKDAKSSTEKKPASEKS